MMNSADSMVPTATIQIVARCSRLGSRSQPNNHSPRNVDSREERRQPLHGQRGAEHVSHEPGVGRPVHAELELLDQPGHHTDRDIDEEDVAEELRQPLQFRVPRAVPPRLQDRRQEGGPMVSRTEQEVVDGRHRELDASEIRFDIRRLLSGGGVLPEATVLVTNG